ncbi:hypothetical protein BH23GEM3_BH23GEM3_20790 [soil metagenome]
MNIELPEMIAEWLREQQAQTPAGGHSGFVAESVIRDLQGSRAFLTHMDQLGQPVEGYAARPIAETYEWDPDEGPTKVPDLTTDQLKNLIAAYHMFSEWMALHAHDLEAVLEERAGEP